MTRKILARAILFSAIVLGIQLSLEIAVFVKEISVGDFKHLFSFVLIDTVTTVSVFCILYFVPRRSKSARAGVEKA